jgi:Uncharacterised protein family UPF0547
MVRMPLWLAGALTFLGGAWVVFGWIFNAGFWFLGLLFAAAYALIVRRRNVSVTLEPWSKERGIVIWAHRRKPKHSVEPRLVWDAAPSTDETRRGRSDVQAPSAVPPHLAPAVPAAASAAAEAERKTCPDCAETVLAAAKVCRYCGYRFEPVDASAPL